MKRIRLALAVCAVMMAVPLVGVQAAHAQDVSCHANAGGSGYTQAMLALVGQNQYQYGGRVGCGTVQSYINLVCKPVHRHTFSWHSHDGIAFPTAYSSKYNPTTYGSVWWNGPITGTSGDTYKSHCDWSSNTGSGSMESPTQTLP